WLADSGTTSHITKIRSALMDYVPLKSHRVSGIANESLKAGGCGTVKLVSIINKQRVTCKLKNVLHVPRASNNLVSITHL
ncbi:uncharacterized protein F5891DRAFT_906858, partial [Suillus fuscotomentosus]